VSIQQTGDPAKDLQRAREATDSLQKLLLAAFTGGIAIMLSFAGSLAGKGVNPKWVVWPAGFFTFGLILSAVSLYMAESRSLRRRSAALSGRETVVIAWWMQGRTWTWLCLVALIASVIASLIAISLIRVPAEISQNELGVWV